MSFSPFLPRHADTLLRLLGPSRVFCGDDISEDFAHDELSGTYHAPDIVVFPETTEEVSRICRFAYDENLPLTTRGAGTGLVGAAVATEGGILLSTSRMNRILELDEKTMTVTTQPGVLLMELSAFAEANGYLYPPDPGEKTATIGGNISTNAGGMRAVRYGVTRDYVRGLTCVLPSGEILELGGKVVKNSSGYSLLNLIIGSEGTLAVITQAVLRLIPLPPVSLSLLVPYDSMEQALSAVSRIARETSNPTAIECMSSDVIGYAQDHLGKSFPDQKSPAYLLLTYDAESKEALTAVYEQAADVCLQTGARDVLSVDTEERKAPVWSARGAFLEAIKASTDEMDECDVVVPRDRLSELIAYTKEVETLLSLRIPSFGHAGDGNLHIYICRDGLPEDVWQEKLREAFRLLYEKAALMGGQVSGEHGIGVAKKKYLAERLGPAQLELMRGIKAAFDPKGILNPGKIL